MRYKLLTFLKAVCKLCLGWEFSNGPSWSSKVRILPCKLFGLGKEEVGKSASAILDTMNCQRVVSDKTSIFSPPNCFLRLKDAKMVRNLAIAHINAATRRRSGNLDSPSSTPSADPVDIGHRWFRAFFPQTEEPQPRCR